MPRYDYRCAPCEATFEINRSAADKTDVPCPSCGITAKRVFTPVGVVFKGSGFHNTDYRSDSRTSKADESKPSETKKASGCSESSCDGCPAASTD